jgi:hypothetical protein
MAVRVLPLRGLANLRTLAGLADRQPQSYKAYLRVSFLELERVRHGQEIVTAQRRLAFLVARCREIDAEKSGILAGSGAPPPPSPPPEAPRTGRPGSSGKRGFRLAY